MENEFSSEFLNTVNEESEKLSDKARENIEERTLLIIAGDREDTEEGRTFATRGGNPMEIAKLLKNLIYQDVVLRAALIGEGIFLL